jgi:hypothetical protein
MTEAAATPAAPATQQATPQQNNALAATLQSAPAGLQPEFIEWGKTKGYVDSDLQKIAADPLGMKILVSYREAEKHLGTLQGADKVILPRDSSDKSAWDAVYTKLGRPASPSGYKFEMPQGTDGNFALTAGNWFHEAGLSQTQAGALNKQWNTYVQAETQRQQQELSSRAAADVAEVMRGWGANAKLHSEVATRGLHLMGKELGLAPERVEAIKNSDQVVLTAGEALKLFRLMGELGKTTSDTFEGAGAGNRGQGLSMTPGEAQARLNQLQNDRSFYERLQKGDAQAVRERNELFRLIGRSA